MSDINATQAYLAACKAMPIAAEKSAENAYAGYWYATLADVLRAVHRPLTDNEFVVFHTPEVVYSEAGEWPLIVVETQLVYAPTCEVFRSITLRCQSAQVKGKSEVQVIGELITYLRKYGLTTICGIATDEMDPDANNREESDASPAAERAAREGALWAELDALAERYNVDKAKIAAYAKASSYEEIPAHKLQATIAGLRARLEPTGTSVSKQVAASEKALMPEDVLRDHVEALTANPRGWPAFARSVTQEEQNLVWSRLPSAVRTAAKKAQASSTAPLSGDEERWRERLLNASSGGEDALNHAVDLMLDDPDLTDAQKGALSVYAQGLDVATE